MKNLIVGIIIGGLLSSIGWYFKSGAPEKEIIKNTKSKPSISDFVDTTKKLSGVSNLFINKDSARNYIKYYEKDHDTAKDKKVTLSIYFDRSVCEFIGNYYLNIASPEVTGIRIYNIQYNKWMSSATRGSHKDPKQQTILLVPTGPDKEPLWDEWDPSNFPQPYLKFFEALNHGELCPKTCPPTN